MPDTLRQFAYPLTCCPMGTVQKNWNDLPVEQLKQAASCSISGDKIYEVVSLFIIVVRVIEMCLLFIGLLQ